MPDIFSEHYSRLNKAQKEAVDTIEGPVMVIAGPGTGKTTILTLRIANILKKTDTPAHGILAITYTDAGVKAMRTKLQQIIGDRAHEVGIFTFHGFANAMIAEYQDHFIHVSDMKLMTDIEQESLIRTIISEPHFSLLRPAGKPDYYISGIIRSIDDAKRDALSPDQLHNFVTSEIHRIKNDESSISTRGATKGKLKAEAQEAIEKCEKTLLFTEVYKLYEVQKREVKKMDYADLILELKHALKNDELLLRLIQERYLYIHIDEHQDTNDSQNEIIEFIATFFETPNLFIVGDEKQAIYRFQGASVENFLKLEHRWKDVKRIKLDTNYRSQQRILDASFGMIEKNYLEDEHKELRIKLKGGITSSTSKGREPVTVVTGENVSATELYLVEQLTSITQQEPNASIAIIVRRNRDLDRVIRLLESKHIPVSSERSVDIFSHPVGRLFFDLIECLVDNTATESLAKTIISGMWNISFDTARELVMNVRSGKDISADVPELVHIRRKMLNDGAIGFLIHAAEQSGFLKIVARDPSYIYVWRGIVTLAESLTREQRIQDPRELLVNLLAYKASAETRIVKVTVGAPDVPIQAMTAHGSKGLEFDYVFIPYATEDGWVSRARGGSFVLPEKSVSGGSDIRDVRRLFYVALTRARKQVTILSALEEADGKVLEPLRCIAEIPEEQVHIVFLKKAAIEDVYVDSHTEQSSNRHTASAEKSRALVDLAKDTLLKKGLSVTALNNFLECPSKFLYNSILKLPQAPSISAEKGTAMHESISHVWQAHLKTVEEMSASMTQSITTFFENSLLSKAEKESAQKKLLEDIPVVARALEHHFGLNGTVPTHTESWVENQYKGTYEDTIITVPIHGKLDAVVDLGNEVLVFDYKTKQAMSIPAIKGETKSDDGGYFRQLIFYYMLVSGDSRWKTKRVTPSLVFVSPDSKGRCPTVTVPIEHADVERVKTEMQFLIDSVWSCKIAQDSCTYTSCEWCGMKTLQRLYYFVGRPAITASRIVLISASGNAPVRAMTFLSSLI
ncbi:MAG: ATP-dependent DNA helicase [Candidatus Taylorbacteria bacterium]